MNKLFSSNVYLAIFIAALGYFIDVYDIILFNAVRVESLKALGLTGDELISTGIHLINLQLWGMLLGGLCWGMIGDRFGRLYILFGSIFIYSTATLINAFITHVEWYGSLRFLAGFGLSGELGAGIALISELMTPRNRGYGTMIIVTSGALGSVFGGLVSAYLSWKTAYLIGGLSGFMLLFLRVRLSESTLFKKSSYHSMTGHLNIIFFRKRTFIKYIVCLFIGMPFWVFAGLFVTFAPELASHLKLNETVTSGHAILFWALGLTVGNLASSFLSQKIQSRKKVTLLFLFFTLFSVILLFNLSVKSVSFFYLLYGIIGFGCGSWAIFNMLTAEQFGTNIRATVTTSLPNFVRGMLIPLVALFTLLNQHYEITLSLEIISIFTIALAIISTFMLKESFAQSLDFIEK